MIEEHDFFKPPHNENVRIWRYMDFTKFVSLLDRRALFFARLDKLADAFEGYYPRWNMDVWRETARKMVPTAAGSPPDLVQLISQLIDAQRKWTAVNCWHVNEHESAAMWRLYLTSHEGIAVQSTFSRLKGSLSTCTERVFLGLVQYLDYEVDYISDGSTLAPLLCKRKSFEHERELRAVIWSPPVHAPTLLSGTPPWDCGVYVQVALERLVETVFLAPGSPRWFVDLTRSVCDRYGLQVDVRQSDLDKSPLY